jgi:hypothetical protein
MSEAQTIQGIIVEDYKRYGIEVVSNLQVTEYHIEALGSQSGDDRHTREYGRDLHAGEAYVLKLPHPHPTARDYGLVAVDASPEEVAVSRYGGRLDGVPACRDRHGRSGRDASGCRRMDARKG